MTKYFKKLSTHLVTLDVKSLLNDVIISNGRQHFRASKPEFKVQPKNTTELVIQKNIFWLRAEKFNQIKFLQKTFCQISFKSMKNKGILLQFAKIIKNT